MGTWIFQGNPKTFNIDGYLAASSGVITWRVKKYSDKIVPGDRVYLWKSDAGEKASGGIVAEGTILEHPIIQIDDIGAAAFYIVPPTETEYLQVKIRLNRIASKKEVIKRDWLREDSVLSSLLIMRQPAGTNYPVTLQEANRLSQLWRKTGSDWSRDEVVAALHLYESLLGQPISKVPGSPVETLSQKIGRAPTGVYNKLMNLRSLDPRNSLQGMSATSTMDRHVWAEFYSVSDNKVDVARLAAEFNRLWGESVVSDGAPEASLEQEIDRLEKNTTQQLKDIYANRPKNNRPQRTSIPALVYDRDPLIIALRKKLAGFKCEVSACPSPTFVSDRGTPFVEVHHIVHLAEGGPDTLDNTVALCPTHHRFLHYGTDRQKLAAALQELRKADAFSPG
jgi:5-methylcytosine-specific restriction endonuclease McrA